jgi:hypothetical protein
MMFALYWPAQRGEPAVRHGKLAQTETQALARLKRAPVGATVRTWPEDITHAVKRAPDLVTRLAEYLL